MFGVNQTRKPGSGRPTFEGPTWLVLAGCYLVWASAMWFGATLGVFVIVPLAISIALFSSLQHEVLHGHPTRNAVLNEALVFLPITLFIPYRRFRDLHLRHHNDSRLTDPYDDPESFYLTGNDAQSRCTLMHAVLAMNATFAGRVVIGPALALYAFWLQDFRLIRARDKRVVDAWLCQLIGLVMLSVIFAAAGADLLHYLAAAYVGMSLIMVRSFIEHRAAELVEQRTAIVDAHWFWKILFLNNNYHLLHHDHPALPWYRLPQLWQAERDSLAQRNGDYVLPGYGHVARRWLFRRREPYVHPLDHPLQTDAAPTTVPK